jgi:hypothetical protein
VIDPKTDLDEQDDLTLCYMYGFKNGKDSLKDEIERLRAALRYYASDAAWTYAQCEGPDGDYGKRARAALAVENADD